MRTQRTLLNLATDIVPMVLIGLIGAYKIRLFLTYLGQETLGAYQLFFQLFMYLTIIEAGFSTAVMHKLYKPVKEQDLATINRLLSGCRVIFNMIALTVFAIGLILSFGLDLFIKDRTLSYSYIQIAFLLNLAANAVNYFYIVYNLMYNLHQKKYKTNLVAQSLVLTRTVIEIILLRSGGDLIAITAVGFVFNFLIQIIIRSMAKKEFASINVHVKDKDFSIKQDIKHLLPIKVTNLITNNIDILVISSFLGLASVAVYSTYNYIISALKNIIHRFADAAISSIGNLTVTDDKDDYLFFRDYNSFMFFSGGVLCVPLILVFNPFIRLWVGEAMLVNNWTALLFVAMLLILIIRTPVGSFVTVYGLFKETKIAAYIGLSINLVLTLVLVFQMGITGVLTATVVSYLVSGPFQVAPLYRLKFKKQTIHYYLDFLKYIVLLSVNGILVYFLMNWLQLEFSSLFRWFWLSCLIFAENLLVTYVLFRIFVREFSLKQRFLTLLRQVRGKIGQRESE